MNKKIGRPKKETSLTAAERQKKCREQKKIAESEKVKIEIVKNLISETKKMYENYYLQSTDEITKNKNLGAANGITMLEIKFERLIENENRI